MNIDLNIDNYDLNDVLKLFKMPYHFSEKELKQAKKIVLKTHPDKSGLDKEYFLFFIRAYKLLHQIYTFRHKIITKDDEIDREYIETLSEHDNDEANEKIIDKIRKNKNFNKLFNDIFETTYGSSLVDNGYSEWLKDDTEVKEVKCKTPGDMGAALNEYKRGLDNVVTIHNIEDFSNSNKFSSLEQKNSMYESDVFSKLKYDDLKNAHENSIIPVLENNNINSISLSQLKSERSKTIAPIEKDKQQEILTNRQQKEEEIACNRAFQLAKESEQYYLKNQELMSKFKQIMNK